MPTVPPQHLHFEEPTLEETVDETLPLFGTVPVYGPPVLVLAAPWLLLALALAGPFAVVLAIVVLLALAAAIVALIGAILAAPFLLFRRYRTGEVTERAPAARLVAVGSQWRAA